MKIESIAFDSFADFLDRVEMPATTAGGFSAATFRPEFFGTSTYAEAVSLGRDGWPDGRKRMEKWRKDVAPLPVPRALSPLPVIAEEGDEVAIDRFLSGESDCWIDYPMAETPKAGRIVSVLVNVTVSDGVSSDIIAERGAIVLALVDALEAAGYRCEVDIAAATMKRGHCFEMRAKVKLAEAPLDLDRLAFVLCSPSITRRFLLRLIEQSPNGGLWIPGYGVPVEVPEESRGDSLYFPSIFNGGERLAMRAARAHLEQFTADPE